MLKTFIKYLLLSALILVFFSVFFVFNEKAYAQGDGDTCTLSPDNCADGYTCEYTSGMPSGYGICVEETTNTGSTDTGSTECVEASPSLTFNVNWPSIGVGTDEEGNTRSFSLNDLAGDDLTLENVINWIYAFFIWVAATVAFVSILFAGFNFVFSGTNPGIRVKAKERMRNALVGIAIVFSVVLFVTVINPDILTLKISGTSEVQGECPEIGMVVDDGLGGSDDSIENTYECIWNDAEFECTELQFCNDGYIPATNCGDIEDPEECTSAGVGECVEEPSEEESGTFNCEWMQTDQVEADCHTVDNKCNDGYEPRFDPTLSVQYQRCEEIFNENDCNAYEKKGPWQCMPE